MMKNTLIILSLLFVAAVVLMPFALSSCGMNGFHMTIGAVANACSSDQNSGHLTFMRGLLTLGLVASIVILGISLFGYLIFILSHCLEPANILKQNLSALRQKFIASCLRPFDQLALAYASGLVQPKIFLHGHTHENLETNLGKTRVISVYGQKIIEV